MALTITTAAASSPAGVQSTYPLTLSEGRLGAHYNTYANEVRSAANGASDVLAFGQPLSRNGVDKVRNFTNANGFAGFALISDTFVPESKTILSESRPAYPDKQMVNVLESGTIWVLTSTDAVQGGVVALLDAGADTVCASGTASSTAIKAIFLKSASANTLVPIQLTSLI